VAGGWWLVAAAGGWWLVVAGGWWLVAAAGDRINPVKSLDIILYL